MLSQHYLANYERYERPAILEIRGVTPRRQNGNPKPRVFRIVSQQGIKNRYGLNSHGSELVAAQLRHRVRRFAYAQGYGSDEQAEKFVLDGNAGVPPGSFVKGKLLAVQVAKIESTSDNDIEAIIQDFVQATSLLARYADIFVVNVSCPNASGYRGLQKIDPLTKIPSSVVHVASSVDRNSRPAIMVKVSPDQDSEEQVSSICAAVWTSGVDGVVVGNTTLSEPSPLPEGTSLSKDETAAMEERGGYSGPQLYPRTLSLVKRYRRTLDYPLHDHDESQQTQFQHQEAKRNNMKEALDESIKSSSTSVLDRSPHHLEQSSTPHISTQQTTLTPKTIFCSGGIPTGEQAMEVIKAGASVAQIYTGMPCPALRALSTAN